MNFGKKLVPGATLGFIGPSGAVRTADAIERAVAETERMGFRVKLGESCGQAYGYLSGTDEVRARDVNSMFLDDEVDAIFCLKGGYGTMRMLDLLDYEAIRAEAKGTVNRAVIAAAMVQHRYCANVEEAFENWLNPERGFYVPPKRPDAFEVIRFIKSIGAVAVLAHPFLNLEEQELREFLSHAEDLDGMEVYYSKLTEEETELAGKIAAEFGLVKSGGSDFHGANKPDIQIGVGKGNLRMPMDTLRQLKMRKNADSEA
jgi:hypothetical protein